jgi:hypothetical protein
MLHCENLQASSISQAIELDEALTALQENSVKDLNLFGKLIGDSGASRLAEALEKNHSCIALNLACNRINEMGARELANAVAKNKSLLELNLRGNNVRTEGAKEIATALEENSTLETLNLGGNGIYRNGCNSILDSIAKNSDTSLTQVNLSGNVCGDLDMAVSTAIKHAQSQARLLVLTLCVCRRPGEDWDISCTNLAGNEVAKVTSNLNDDGIGHMQAEVMDLSSTLDDLRGSISKQTNFSKKRLRLILPDGTDLSTYDGSCTLSQLAPFRQSAL